MDRLYMTLSTKFMRNLVSKLIAKSIYKKYGYKINVQLDNLDVSVIDGETDIKANVEVKLESSEFMKIIKDINLD